MTALTQAQRTAIEAGAAALAERALLVRLGHGEGRDAPHADQDDDDAATLRTVLEAPSVEVVRTEEREACALLCDERARVCAARVLRAGPGTEEAERAELGEVSAGLCAGAIRMRGAAP